MFLFISNVNYNEWVERWTCIYDVLLCWWYRRFKWCTFIILWEKSFSIFLTFNRVFRVFLLLLSLFEKWFQQLMKYDTIDLFNWKFVRIIRLFPSLFIHDLNARVYRVYCVLTWRNTFSSNYNIIRVVKTFVKLCHFLYTCFTGMFKIIVFPTYFSHHAVFFQRMSLVERVWLYGFWSNKLPMCSAWSQHSPKYLLL